MRADRDERTSIVTSGALKYKTERLQETGRTLKKRRYPMI
jgi:hypothetical protein